MFLDWIENFCSATLSFELPNRDLVYIFTVVYATLIIFKRLAYYKNLPPGPWGIPVLGYLPFINRKTPHSWYLEKSAQYGDIFSVKLGNNLVVCIGSVKLLKELFTRSDSTGRPHTPLNELLGGYGIILSEGILWKKQRQFLQDKFSALGVRLRPNQHFEKYIIMEIEELLVKVDKLNGKPVDPMLMVGRHMHNIICQLMMSFRFEENDKEFTMFNERVTRGMKLYGSVHIGEHVKHYLKLPGKKAVVKEIKRNLSDISEFHSKRLVDRSKQFDDTAGSYKPADLLDHYLDQMNKERNSNKAFTIFPNVDPDKQIVQVMNDLFSAGMETSRAALCWSLLMITREPTVAAKLRLELRQVLPAGELVTLEHRSSLPYLEAVIYETLRRAAVVPMGTTHVNNKVWKVGCYIIPAGTHIIPLINKINLDPEIYTEPEKFKPERFLKNGKFHMPENFMSFGVGQRMCLGIQLAKMELFLFFANLINRYDISLSEGHEAVGLEGVLGVTHAPLPFTLSLKKLQN